MSDAHDYSTLKWVRPELEATIEQARLALEAFAEGAGDTGALPRCIERIHQIGGVFQMMRLYGAALLAEEMEATATALRDGEVRAEHEAVEALAFSLVHLPGYLEQVEAGAPDAPLYLLPQLNELRAARDVALLSEVALFAPDLDRRLAGLPTGGEPAPGLPDLVRARRSGFHRALLGWFRSGDPAQGLGEIARLLDEVERAAGTERVAAFFRAGRAFVQGLRERSIETGTATRQLLGRFDRELRRLVAGGEQALVDQPPDELLKNMLYYLSGAESGDALVLETRSAYGLDRVAARGAGGLGTSSRELMASVRSAVESDLGEIKDRIDLFIRSEESDLSRLLGLEVPMRKLGDTLGMVGQGELRKRLKRQADLLAASAESGALPDEQALMAMAADIVFVEVSLENLAGARRRDPALAATGEGLPEGEFERLVGGVVAEAAVEISHGKDAVTAFIANPRDPAVLADVPARFHAVAGAFRMLGISKAPELLDRLSDYVADRLLGQGEVPNDQALNDFADALTSIEYFMEAIADGRGVQESIIAVARASLGSLTGEGLPAEAEALEAQTAHALETEPSSSKEGALVLPPEAAEAPAAALEEAEGGMDAEILAIFVEEAREQLATIGGSLPAWAANRGDAEALATLRRAFHTLKGSGRMVGASAIGEFAWSMENMLNRVIDGTIPASDELVGLLAETPKVLDRLVACQEHGAPPDLDCAPLMERAFALAEAAGAAAAPEAKGEAVAEAAPPISIDPELAEVFQSEARGHLEALRRFVEGCRAGSAGCGVDDGVVRAFHTLRGSANLAEVAPIARIGAAMEALADAMKAGGREAGDAELDLFDRALASVESVLTAVNRRGAELPAWEPLAGEIEAATEGLRAAPAAPPKGEEPPVRKPKPRTAAPEPAETEQGTIEGDPELVGIFLEESQELFEAVERGFQAWHAEPKELSPLSALQRTLHTLKGAARFAGISAIGDLSHGFETLISAVEKGALKPSGSLLQLAQGVVDRLAEQIADAGKGAGVRPGDDLLERMAEFGGAPASAGAKPKREKPRGAPPAEGLAPTLERPVQPPAEKPTPKTPSEQIRVRSDLLDRLVNNAGEISIFRSRLEQQNSELGHNLAELRQTVNRLKQQLRKLEMETETQILFRYEREQERGREMRASFDPLELDRFSAMQQISRSLMETVGDLTSIASFLDEERRDTDTLLQQQSRVTTDLQDGLLRTRMVPFSQLVPRLHRLVRQTCRTLEKQAELEVWGAEGEIDRRILDRMIGPLEHLLRNAVSHGIEKPGRRAKAGKPETGRISLALSREGTEVVLDIADDGAGIPVDMVRRRAIERGLLDPDAEVRDGDVMRFVLEHGFSTADEVTQISGRGVGLDVVVSEVKQIGGSVDLASRAGEGTRFQVRLPLTLAISDALLIRLSDEVYAIPHTALEGVIRMGRDELAACYAGDRTQVAYAGNDYDVHYLGSFLRTGQPVVTEQQKWYPLLLVHSGEHRVALHVDELIGNRQIVVKPVGPQLSTISWLSGGTILADGRVALIVDLIALVRLGVAGARAAPLPDSVAVPEGERIRTVMVVDDSITVRRVTGHVLARHGLQVITAKDGVEALAVLQEHRPDIMLLDIEMPRMDGYELARHMRNAEELRGIPIIMITSRTGDKHRKLALDLGVKRYLGKPYQEAELLDNIYSVLAEGES